MAWKTLLTEQFGAVLRITANRPHVLNAQSRVLLNELDAALNEAVADASVRVIIIAGAGKHFSAGHDLGSPEELEDRRLNPRGTRHHEEYAELEQIHLKNCLHWRSLPKPTIAQVQGYCIMGGLMVASVCDLIVASDDALFADRMVGWGGAHVQYFSMPWDLGPRKAKEYLFTSEFITAADAARLGLVNRVCAREELEQETLALATKIAQKDPFGLAMAKRSVNEMMDLQGFTHAAENSFKNYMLCVQHRKEIGTFGEATPDPKSRIAKYNVEPGDPGAS
jgi:enoyl-CoA hydratase